MFEHIHFSKSFSSLEITAEDIVKQAGREDLKHPVTQYSNADFHIHGPVRALFPYPITPENRENYLFLQDFNYMHADESYYSRQHGYPSYQLLYTYSGKAEMTYRQKRHALTPRTVFLADCTFSRAVKTWGKSWECSDLHFYGGKSRLLYETWISGKTPLFTVKDTARFQTLLEDILIRHTTVSPYREWSVSSAIENLLLFILEADPESGREIPERIQYLITYIENNFSQPLSLDMLSDFAGLSKYHLSREFKRFTGYSPYAYITELRLDRAKSMLVQTSLPAYRIALLSGFGDESNFIKLFKEKTAMTPGEYRQRQY